MIKTFRGLLADGDQDKIRLSTKKGKIGYRINKFQLLSNDPNSVAAESIVKIFKVKQSAVTDLFDFSDGNLLAAAYFSNSDNPAYTADQQIIFDQEVFNQDIYITCHSAQNTEPCNYYLEIETITLTDNAAAVSTLRDIRLNPQVGA